MRKHAIWIATFALGVVACLLDGHIGGSHTIVAFVGIMLGLLKR